MFKYIFLILCLANLILTPVNAKIIFSSATIAASQNINAWTNAIKQQAITELMQFKNDSDGYTECRKTREDKRIILCGTYLQRDMNALLLRAAMYSEGGIGGHVKHALVATDDKHIRAHLDVIAGHDIKSVDLLNFYAKANSLCTEGQTRYCLTTAENNFYQRIVKPLSATNNDFVIISFSVQSAATPDQIISHEFIHAKYFLDPNYKSKITAFWKNRMTTADRNKIRLALSSLGYNKNDDDLIRNEFQAYILMHDPEDSVLSEFVSQYQHDLITLIST